MMLYQEGTTLEAVLEALKPVADWFVLGVDRQSTDETASIAKSFADDYFEFNFHNDFSEVRNKVLSRVPTRWVMQVDGHEVLTSESVEFIREAKEQEKSDIVNVILNIWDEHEPLMMLLFPRLFRTDRGIRYKRKVHNTLTHVDGHNKYLSLPARKDPGIILDHRQPAGRRKMRDEQRDLISIERIHQQAMDWNDSYDWYNLGVLQTYQEDGEAAKTAFKNALDNCERDDARYQIKLSLAGLEKQGGDREAAKSILASATIDDAFRCEGLVELGILYEEENELVKALSFYSCATHLVERFGVPVSYMTVYLPYHSYFPVERIMTICGKRGDLKGAIEAGERLREFKFFRHRDQLDAYLEKFKGKLDGKGKL